MYVRCINCSYNNVTKGIRLLDKNIFVYTANILKAKSNFTLLLFTPFLGIGEWHFKCD